MSPAEMEADIRQCSQRKLQQALRQVEDKCEPQLDAFVSPCPHAIFCLLLPALAVAASDAFCCESHAGQVLRRSEGWQDG